jgi:hypothetical protein
LSGIFKILWVTFTKVYQEIPAVVDVVDRGGGGGDDDDVHLT